MATPTGLPRARRPQESYRFLAARLFCTIALLASFTACSSEKPTPPLASPRGQAAVRVNTTSLPRDRAVAKPQPSVRNEPIVLGSTTSIDGPAASLGRAHAEGWRLAVERYNAGRTDHERPIRFVVEDDGYDPDRIPGNIESILDHEQALALVGNVGTPTAVVTVPILRRRETLLFAPLTGAAFLRDPSEPYLIHYRASYAQEIEAILDAVMRYAKVPPDRIAFFTQRDAYGDAGFEAGLRILRAAGAQTADVLHVRYERFSVAVEPAVADLLEARTPPEAIVMVGTCAPCAKFMKLCGDCGIKALFFAVSFTDADCLAHELGPTGLPVVVTQVVPHYDADLPLVRRYRDDLERSDDADQPRFASLEGYVAGSILTKAISSWPGPVNRETIIEALRGLGTFDLGIGVPMSLGPGDNQACDTVWPVEVVGGHCVPFEWRRLGRGRPGDE